MLHRNRRLMQAHPLAQQCWEDMTCAGCTVMLACCRGSALVFLDKTHVDSLRHNNIKPWSVYACVYALSLQQIKLFVKTWICSLLSCPFFFFFFFSHRTSFLVLCVPPIPHFLLFHLVWLWGLGWRGNGGHRPVSILFARFLLLQAYCTFAAGIGKSLAPPSPTHTLSETCRREWVLRKYKRYQSLPVIYTDDFGPACV